MGTRRIALAGILAALTVVATVFTRIPVPLAQGYFNLGDTVVFVAAALFGGFTGAFAGAVGSAFADVLTGAYLFAPISLIVKGLMGLAVGRLLSGGHNTDVRLLPGGHNTDVRLLPTRGGMGLAPGARLAAAFAVGAVVMVAGYFAAEATLLALLDRSFGLGAALAELPANIAQGVLSAALAGVAVGGLKKSGLRGVVSNEKGHKNG